MRETSVHGYLLTDLNEVYLEPYENSERTIQKGCLRPSTEIFRKAAPTAAVQKCSSG